MPLNYDNVTAICQKKYIPLMADNIFNSSYLFKQMKDRRDTIDGGSKLVAPLLYAKGRGGHVAEWGQLDVRPKETRTAAEYDWRQSYANMTISSMQEDKCNGDSAVLNLIETEMKIAEETLSDIISTALWNTGTDDTAPHGLRHMINVDRSLGGIDSTTYVN